MDAETTLPKGLVIHLNGLPFELVEPCKLRGHHNNIEEIQTLYELKDNSD